MEELNVVRLTQRKESNVQLASDLSPLRPTNDESDNRIVYDIYPHALVLRLRVLQIVCGISALVMGSVAFIEERRESNLGLGVPAGSATVIAAAASIHTWRERGRTRSSKARSVWSAALRSLGPVPLAILWVAACAFHFALLVQSIKTIIYTETKVMSSISDSNHNIKSEPEDLSRPSPRDLTVLAGVQIVLTLTTLACVATLAKVEFREA